MKKIPVPVTAEENDQLVAMAFALHCTRQALLRAIVASAASKHQPNLFEAFLPESRIRK
jgi:hypothetical protein